MEPPNDGHVGDEHFVNCSEVVPSSEVEMYGQLMEGGKQFVHCREVVLLSECPLSEVLLYMFKKLHMYCTCLIPIEVRSTTVLPPATLNNFNSAIVCSTFSMTRLLRTLYLINNIKIEVYGYCNKFVGYL